MVGQQALAAADIQHRAAGPEVMEVGGDHAIAGQLVEAAHELPAALPVLLLPDLLADRRVAPAGRQLPGVNALGQPLGERKAAAEEQLVKENVDGFEGPAAELPDHWIMLTVRPGS